MAISSARVTWGPAELKIVVAAQQRADLSCAMTGYTERDILYGNGDMSLEGEAVGLPAVARGQPRAVRLTFNQSAPRRIHIDVLLPTRFSAHTHMWLP